jgi:hypothetical protein
MSQLAELFPKEVRASLAFELLASSSISRYIRVARSFATSSSVEEAIASRDISVQDLLGLARESWRLIASGDMRDEEEVDLALALCILSDSADPEVDEFLQQVGMLDRPPLSWASGLARYLSYHRPANSTTTRMLERILVRWVWAGPAKYTAARVGEQAAWQFWVLADLVSYYWTRRPLEDMRVRSAGTEQQWSPFKGFHNLIKIEADQDSRSRNAQLALDH